MASVYERYRYVSADNQFCFAVMENRYRLSVLADMECHIGSLTDTQNFVKSGIIFDERTKDFIIFSGYQNLFRPK